MLGFMACPGTSDCVLGVKVCEEGAVPAGRVSAWNSGAASLPTFVPGACYDKSQRGMKERRDSDIRLLWSGDLNEGLRSGILLGW